jgi:hypothetical protein
MAPSIHPLLGGRASPKRTHVHELHYIAWRHDARGRFILLSAEDNRPKARPGGRCSRSISLRAAGTMGLLGAVAERWNNRANAQAQ